MTFAFAFPQACVYVSVSGCKWHTQYGTAVGDWRYLGRETEAWMRVMGAVQGWASLGLSSANRTHQRGRRDVHKTNDARAQVHAMEELRR